MAFLLLPSEIQLSVARCHSAMLLENGLTDLVIPYPEHHDLTSYVDFAFENNSCIKLSVTSSRFFVTNPDAIPLSKNIETLRSMLDLTTLLGNGDLSNALQIKNIFKHLLPFRLVSKLWNSAIASMIIDTGSQIFTMEKAKDFSKDVCDRYKRIKMKTTPLPPPPPTEGRKRIATSRKPRKGKK